MALADVCSRFQGVKASRGALAGLSAPGSRLRSSVNDLVEQVADRVAVQVPGNFDQILKRSGKRLVQDKAELERARKVLRTFLRDFRKRLDAQRYSCIKGCGHGDTSFFEGLVEKMKLLC
jgi:hypothetical protein